MFKPLVIFLIFPPRVLQKVIMVPSLPMGRQAVGSPSPCKESRILLPRRASSPELLSTYLRVCRYGVDVKGSSA